MCTKLGHTHDILVKSKLNQSNVLHYVSLQLEPEIYLNSTGASLLSFIIKNCLASETNNHPK
jgi:hypothetical protein